MATTSQRLSTIRRELQAQKATYRRASSTLQLYTKTLTFSTKKNACHFKDTNPPVFEYDYEDNERVVVTLTTPSGYNTMATLEITGDYEVMPVVKRVPFSGGVRWYVSTSPRYNWGDHTWLSTTYNFTVQTLVNGTLTAKMYWE